LVPAALARPLDQEEARTMLAEKPVGFIFGVGPATQERLVQRGFRIIADLQKADEIELMRQCWPGWGLFWSCKLTSQKAKCFTISKE